MPWRIGVIGWMDVVIGGGCRWDVEFWGGLGCKVGDWCGNKALLGTKSLFYLILLMMYFMYI